MDDKITMEVSKEFMSFWSRLSPTVQKNETTKLVAIWAWEGGLKQRKKIATEEETSDV